MTETKERLWLCSWPPLWRAAAQIAVATGIGNVVFFVCVSMALGGAPLLGSLSRPALYAVAVLLVVLATSELAGASDPTKETILVAAFLAVMTTTWVGSFLDCGTWILGQIVPFAVGSLAGFPVAGFVFALSCPQASRRRVLLAVALGILLFWVATVWAIFACVTARNMQLRMPNFSFAWALFAVVAGYPLTVVVTSRILIKAAEAGFAGRPVPRRRGLRMFAVALVAVTFVFLIARVPRCWRAQAVIKAIRFGDIDEAKRVLQETIDVNATNEVGLAPLHYAVARGDAELIRLLIGKGAEVNARMGLSDQTPLHAASLAGDRISAEILIENGADPNARDEEGSTPLHIAAAFAQREVVMLLIGNGADINATDKNGSTPLDWAAKTGKNETANLLRKHGGKSGEELK